MHINELHDLLNAMEQAGFTQRERNNERFRGIAQRLLAAHNAGAQATPVYPQGVMGIPPWTPPGHGEPARMTH